MKTINIVQLYPKEMNIYGDNGNVLVLKKRLEWRGMPVKVHHIGVGDSLPSDTHIILGGGGQDKGQSLIADDLKHKAKHLHRLADENVPMLMICGMYQMFGHYFKTHTGEKIPGIGVLDMYTVAGEGRLIGNIATKTKYGELVGYENHSGLTYLNTRASALGLAKKQQGNNGEDETEGSQYNNVIGSYLHGPVLAKAPRFADFLIEQALMIAGVQYKVEPLEDTLEDLAAQIAIRRPR